MKKGTSHQLLDAVSRLPRLERPKPDVDDTIPDEVQGAGIVQEPTGQILDGALLSKLGVEVIDTPKGDIGRRCDYT